MGSETELQLDSDWSPGRRAPPADGFLGTARRLGAVECPGDRFEQRGLPCPVRSDYARETGPEDQLGVLVLTEVHQTQPFDVHQP